ncbi:hypothetical protein [Robertmurraya massiliosenegalensis]|uniref:hypothetical protein n=1 Tax=Robertmurraya massiliosenegalensis TaxID=1287657 RepID=UPI00031AEBCC|nr:hypothetical protein [Robertmurraya massiliosenegalensis]
MERTELRSMRMKQAAVTNFVLIVVMIIYLLIMSSFTITISHMYVFLGGIIFIQAIYGFIKGDSTKSIIPIFEKIAIYEKQKMGREWSKQRKVSNVWQLILSGLFFLNSYWFGSELVFQTDLMFMGVIVFFIMLFLNVGMMIHFKKVDRSTSIQDFNGHTWKMNLLSIAIGIILALVLIIITFYYIAATI